jgi:hypothetical protein
MHGPLNVKFVMVKTTLDMAIVYDLRCIKNCACGRFEGMWKGERRYSTIHSYFRHLMKISQLQAPAALLQGKRAPAPTEREGGGGSGPPEAVWTLWMRYNSCSYRESNQDNSDIQPVAWPLHLLSYRGSCCEV